MVRLIRVERGQIPLSGLSRRRKAVMPAVPESDVQAAIVDGLRLHGLEVLITSRVMHRARCPKCAAWFWPGGNDGATKGLPDLCVRRSKSGRFGEVWPRRLWVLMEVKPDQFAKVRPEQLELAESGGSIIVYTLADALAAVKEVDERMDGIQCKM
jgi:hypothetical protein